MATEAKKEENTPEVPFKKPMLVGKIGKFPKRFKTVPATPEPEKTESPEEESTIGCTPGTQTRRSCENPAVRRAPLVQLT
jgi:hypothetical protein